MQVPVFRRRYLVVFFKHFAEVRGVGKTGLGGYIRNFDVGVPEDLLGVLQLDVHLVFGKGLPNLLAEQAA